MPGTLRGDRRRVRSHAGQAPRDGRRAARRLDAGCRGRAHRRSSIATAGISPRCCAIPRACALSWVTLPEPMAIEETADAVAALAAAGIPVARRHRQPRHAGARSRACGWCDARRALERRRHQRLEAARRAGAAALGRRSPARGRASRAALARSRAIGAELERGADLRRRSRARRAVAAWRPQARRWRGRAIGAASRRRHAAAALRREGRRRQDDVRGGGGAGDRGRRADGARAAAVDRSGALARPTCFGDAGVGRRRGARHGRARRTCSCARSTRAAGFARTCASATPRPSTRCSTGCRAAARGVGVDAGHDRRVMQRPDRPGAARHRRARRGHRRHRCARGSGGRAASISSSWTPRRPGMRCGCSRCPPSCTTGRSALMSILLKYQPVAGVGELGARSAEAVAGARTPARAAGRSRGARRSSR